MTRLVSHRTALLSIGLALVLYGQAGAQATAEKIKEPDVIFVPTPEDVVARMLELAAVKKTDVLYDLGCGDGRIVVTAAEKYGCKATGFDVDPQRIKESNERVKSHKVESLVKIEQKDIFTLDLSPANVVTLYLLPSLNVKLIPQLEKLKPGSRIVSHDFDMKGVKPDKVENFKAKDGSTHTIYFWTTPLKKEGAKEGKTTKQGKTTKEGKGAKGGKGGKKKAKAGV